MNLIEVGRHIVDGKIYVIYISQDNRKVYYRLASKKTIPTTEEEKKFLSKIYDKKFNGIKYFQGEE